MTNKAKTDSFILRLQPADNISYETCKVLNESREKSKRLQNKFLSNTPTCFSQTKQKANNLT